MLKCKKPKKDRKHLERVKSLPCCVCGAYPPSDVHHCKGHEFGTGAGLKASDYDTIPLCKAHHQSGPHGFHHMGKRAWEEMFKPQTEYLKQIKLILGVD